MRILFCLLLYPLFAIRVIVFDFGGVIAHSSEQDMLDFISESLHIPKEEAEVVAHKWHHQLSTGVMNEQEVMGKLPYAFPPNWLCDLEDVVAESIHPIPGMLELVRDLKCQGYQVALLSNTIPLHAAAIRKRGLYKPFCPVVLSCEVGYVKPDPMIYKILLGRLSCPASEVLFIDDREENVEAARKLGMHAIHFTSYTSTAAELNSKLAS